ncbi:MAG TPA: FAD-dependent oxidoreductase, partial [Saprospiraceae bacterium]|nr:FAD-dependent oxidoreductase [Saprospiraceae bacterium]
ITVITFMTSYLRPMQRFDFVIIGGGIFGCYAALYLAGKGARVALLEKEARLFQKASLVNQARLHGGYHYPRSVATAAMSDEHKDRFTAEHRRFVNFTFEKFYAIDRFGSFTDPLQFERFCQYLGIRCERVLEHNLFNFNRLEALYRTEEYSFDPVLLREHYREKVENTAGISIFKNTTVESATATGNLWTLELQHSNTPALQHSNLETAVVINATYAATNAINRLFGVDDLALTHEISEIAFVASPQFAAKGLTVMDGPFGSIMPYGLSGLLSLSSVAYTHHKISYDNLPRFDCQTPDDPRCRPEAPGICTDCPRRPESNAGKMLAQMRQYFSEFVHFEHLFSYYTIKSKLKASYIDDGRPTEISMLRAEPRFYCLFAGKINSIYEVEKIV